MFNDRLYNDDALPVQLRYIGLLNVAIVQTDPDSGFADNQCSKYEHSLNKPEGIERYSLP